MSGFTHIVRNQSSRNGSKPKLLVAHTTQGANQPGLLDLQALANWFDTTAAQASSHMGVDKDGNWVRMVPDSRKAWTQAAFNPICLSTEFVGFAEWTPKDWQEADAGLHEMAKHFAIWAHKYDIPVQWSTTHGICEHRDLGVAGGGHHDCGPNFPRSYFLKLVNDYYQNKVTAEAAKKKHWSASLVNARATLKSLLASRRKLRQRGLENSAQYHLTDAQLAEVKTRIQKLLSLISRKGK